jgi:energy-coupling factor transporter ATP-binding protein EcfA2/DNA-directed RNA polymerase subunit RPC12/RpoP
MEITGVKGVLNKSGEFNFKEGKSTAIFAPNGCGKSGYVDALEYLFSSDGSVEHLGKGSADSERGGKHAIPHVLAEKSEIPSQISVTLKNSELRREISITRPVKTGRSDTIPPELYEVIAKSPAHRVLRQHDLRRFVVDMDPREKYSEISRWLGLEHLEGVLAQLTTTENELKNANPDREIAERLRDIEESTGGEVLVNDPEAAFCWSLLQIQKYFVDPISIESFEDLNNQIKKLEEFRDNLNVQIITASRIAESKKNLENSQTILLDKESGPLFACRQNLIQLKGVNEEILRLRESTKEAVFQDVWVSSKQLLEAGTIANCPVCLTPWNETGVGSQENACVHLSSSLSLLKTYHDAQTRFGNLCEEFQGNLKRIMNILRKAQPNTNALTLEKVSSDISQIETEIDELFSNDDVLLKIDRYDLCFKQCEELFSVKLTSELGKIITEETPDRTKEIQNLIDRLKKLDSALIRLDQLDEEAKAYQQVTQEFDNIAGIIRSRTGDLVNSIIQSLKAEVIQIFKKIQVTDAVPDIIIEQDSTNKTILLRVNFHSNDRRVPPAGYLSESQLNTLGLAIFICSVKMFNRDFPFIVLDDVVSSYDADHRARIVDVIAEDLSDFQVFLTTHDERFYNSLKMRLTDKEWQFDRISGWAIDSGPKKQSDFSNIEHIMGLIDNGDPKIAGNALRQHIEEWLDKKCADYEVRIVHKRPLKEYDRTIFDYWNPFIEKLKGLKEGYFKNQIETQACYERLKANSMLNYYSHWQANPYEWGAMGDVKYVFKEFQEFEKLFNCYSCSKPLKYDHNTERVYCTCGGQFLHSLKTKAK